MRLIAAFLCAAFAAGPAGAQSAWEQAKELAGPNYRPPELPTPQMQCETCGSRSAPKTATSPPRTAPARSASRSTPPALPAGVTLGAAIFGSILQQALSNPFEDSGPDPAELARQEEARHQAEAEARRRAAEEEARHRALLGALKAAPAAGAALPAPSTGLGLKALASLEAPASAESLRSQASVGWDTPGMRFAVRFRPLAVSEPLPVVTPRRLCETGNCRWPEAGRPVAPKVSVTPPRVHRPDAQAIVDLLAAGQKPGSASRSITQTIAARLMALPLEPEATLLTRLVKLGERSRLTVIELIKVIGNMVIDEVVPGGKALMLMRDVYELADQSLADAVKVAGWLGSINTDAPPEITEIEEAAKPFLFRGITEQEHLAESLRNAFTVVTEGTELAKRLLAIWGGKP